jgi:hypothetical protein
VTRRTALSLSAANLAFTVSISKKTQAVINAASSLQASLVRQTAPAINAGVGFAGSVSRQVVVSLSAATQTLQATLSTLSILLVSIFASTAASAASMQRQTSASLNAGTFVSGSVSRQISKGIASSMNFVASAGRGFTKFFNAVMQALSAAFQAVHGSNPPVPPPFVPTTVEGMYWASSFGITSPTNPCLISLFSPSTQIFSAPEDLDVFQPPTAGWSRLGQQAMPGQMLIAPSSGFMPPGCHAVLAGDAFIPADTTGYSLAITLYQNVFTQVGNAPIQVQSYAWGAQGVQLVPGQTVSWSVVFPVDYTSQWGAGHNMPLQLSVGVRIIGSSSAAPNVRMMQFQLQQS